MRLQILERDSKKAKAKELFRWDIDNKRYAAQKASCHLSAVTVAQAVVRRFLFRCKWAIHVKAKKRHWGATLLQRQWRRLCARRLVEALKRMKCVSSSCMSPIFGTVRRVLLPTAHFLPSPPSAPAPAPIAGRCAAGVADSCDVAPDSLSSPPTGRGACSRRRANRDMNRRRARIVARVLRAIGLKHRVPQRAFLASLESLGLHPDTFTLGINTKEEIVEDLEEFRTVLQHYEQVG
jgi:hypothetical protein